MLCQHSFWFAIAQQAFYDAVSRPLQEDFYKDSTLIMQLLRDNLTVSHFPSDVTTIYIIPKQNSWSQCMCP